MVPAGLGGGGGIREMAGDARRAEEEEEEEVSAVNMLSGERSTALKQEGKGAWHPNLHTPARPPA